MLEEKNGQPEGPWYAAKRSNPDRQRLSFQVLIFEQMSDIVCVTLLEKKYVNHDDKRPSS